MAKQFSDVEFAGALLRHGNKCIGGRLSLLPFVDIDDPPVQVVWLDHMLER